MRGIATKSLLSNQEVLGTQGKQLPELCWRPRRTARAIGSLLRGLSFFPLGWAFLTLPFKLCSALPTVALFCPLVQGAGLPSASPWALLWLSPELISRLSGTSSSSLSVFFPLLITSMALSPKSGGGVGISLRGWLFCLVFPRQS